MSKNVRQESRELIRELVDLTSRSGPKNKKSTYTYVRHVPTKITYSEEGKVTGASWREELQTRSRVDPEYGKRIRKYFKEDPQVLPISERLEEIYGKKGTSV